MKVQPTKLFFFCSSVLYSFFSMYIFLAPNKRSAVGSLEWLGTFLKIASELGHNSGLNTRLGSRNFFLSVFSFLSFLLLKRSIYLVWNSFKSSIELKNMRLLALKSICISFCSVSVSGSRLLFGFGIFCLITFRDYIFSIPARTMRTFLISTLFLGYKCCHAAFKSFLVLSLKLVPPLMYPI